MRWQLRRAASSGKLPGSRGVCYFFPRGGGQADRVRAVDLAANSVGLPLDVPDAAPPAVLGVVVVKAQAVGRHSVLSTPSRPKGARPGLLLAALLRRGTDQREVSGDRNNARSVGRAV